MGLCSSRGEDGIVHQTALKKEDIELTHDKPELYVPRKRVKLLLLGTGDSGKTTILKQLRLLHGVEHGDQREVSIVAANLIQGTSEILKGCKSFNYPLKNPASIGAAEVVIAAASSYEKQLTEELANAISVLWNDEQFQKVWEQQAKLEVPESYGELASRCCDFPKWGGPGWNPTPRETLLVYHRTTGVYTETFWSNDVRLEVVDVGGQRSERRKWERCLDDEVTAIIFVVAVSEYDQRLLEERRMNRLEEAFQVFTKWANKPYFQDRPIFLFLNKVDLFAEKYHERGIPINQSGLFPDAPTDGDVNKGLEWMEKRFIKLDKSKDRNIFIHKICALNSDHVRTTLDSILEAVLQSNLVETGLIEPDDRK